MQRAPIADLDTSDVEEALRQGGRFVLYYYCVTIFFWSFKKPGRIQLLRPGPSGTWRGLPMTLSCESWFWRGVPYTLFSLLVGGPLVAIGGVCLTWFLYTSNFPQDQEVNVLIVIPAFVLTFWGLPWGWIYLFSVLVNNSLGGQDVTAEVVALLEEEEPIPESAEESAAPADHWSDAVDSHIQEQTDWSDQGTLPL